MKEKHTYSKKKVLILTLIGIIIIISGYIMKEDRSNENSTLVEKVNNIGKKEATGNLSIDQFTGYWESDQYSIFIEESTFMIMNSTDNRTTYFNIKEFIPQKEDVMVKIELDEDKSNDELINNASELTLNLMDNKNKLVLDAFDDQINFTKISDETELKPSFVDFVQTDGVLIPEIYEEVNFEDFKGYWYYFDNYGDEYYPFGKSFIYISEDYMKVGFTGSSVMLSIIYEHTIEGNTIEIKEELIDSEGLDMFNAGYADSLDRTISYSTLSLFKEEDDRDRIVSHETGAIFQRVEEEELNNALSGTYFVYLENDNDYYREVIETIENLSEDQYELVENKKETYDSTPENYPYSTGDLSKRQLYEESEIIKGNLDHPEENIDYKDAVSKLLSGSYESTPTLEDLNFGDDGYYFSTDSFSSGDVVGSLMIGQGGRGEWQSSPLTLDIKNVELKNNIFTISTLDLYADDDGETLEFYRISDDVIYSKDSDGKFSNRYEKDTNWLHLHGLPTRNGWGY